MSEQFNLVFAALRDIMVKHAGGLVITRDAPGDLVIRTHDPDAKGQPGWFGALTIKKSYVAYHLPPLYQHPALAEALSPGLARRCQGKTCFNFKLIEPTLFEELDELTLRVRRTIRA